jgi:Phage P22-like portal protein
MTDRDNDDILIEAKERYRQGQEAWNQYQQGANDTLKFYAGDQWDSQLKMNRDNAGLPSLTVNKLPSFLRQLTSEIRQNTPSIQIDPKDDQASEDTAEVLSDLIRTIQNESDADTAYDIAATSAAGFGLGFFRIVSEYESVDSFDQKLVIKAIDDPSTVIIDPTHRDAAGSDMNWAFVVTTISKDDYIRLYPESQMAATVAVHGWTENDANWVTEEEVLIAEYYYKEWKEEILYLLVDPVTGSKQTSVGMDDVLKEAIAQGQLVVANKRPVQIPRIKWCKLNDVEILEETIWPGQFIPIIPIKGDEMWVDQKRVLKGAVEDAVDSQRAFNYFFSLQAELVQLAPKTPFIGEIRQFANFESLWRNANVAPNAYLPYNAVGSEGNELPPPQRQSVEVPIQAAATLCAQADANLRAVFGIYGDQQGEATNAESGKAVLARVEQSHTTNYMWYDNTVRSITHAGRVLVEAVPVFYDSERLLQLTNVAGEKRAMVVNAFDPKSKKFIDLTIGKFDVVIQTGASYKTRRQEAVTSMLALGAGYPDAMPLISDIMVRNMDWPGAKEIADRLHAAVPPQILEATEGGQQEPEQVVIQLKNQLQQMKSQLDNAMKVGSELEVELRIAKEELNLTKMDKSIEMKKAEMDFKTDQRKLDVEEATVEIQARIDMRKMDLEEAELQLKREGLMADIASDVMDHGHKKAAHDHKVNVDTIEVTPPSSESLDGQINE